MRKATEKVTEGGFVGMNRVINLVKRRNYILIRKRKEMQRGCDLWLAKTDRKV